MKGKDLMMGAPAQSLIGTNTQHDQTHTVHTQEVVSRPPQCHSYLCSLTAAKIHRGTFHTYVFSHLSWNTQAGSTHTDLPTCTQSRCTHTLPTGTMQRLPAGISRSPSDAVSHTAALSLPLSPSLVCLCLFLTVNISHPPTLPPYPARPLTPTCGHIISALTQPKRWSPGWKSWRTQPSSTVNRSEGQYSLCR